MIGSGPHGLALIEDCAQSIGATWDGRPAGSVANTGGMLATVNPGTISAVGANFFLTDVNDLFAPGKLTISLIQSGLTTTMDLMPLSETA